MNRRILKKDVIIKEFVDDEGAIVSDKTPVASSSEIESDITTDNYFKKTRQGISNNGSPGNRYGASFGMVSEDNELPSSVYNSIDELKTSFKMSDISLEQIKGILQQVYNEIKNGE